MASDSADKPVLSKSSEIEITPEMEAAGIDALSGYDPATDSAGEFANRVFRAMSALDGQRKHSQDKRQ